MIGEGRKVGASSPGSNNPTPSGYGLFVPRAGPALGSARVTFQNATPRTPSTRASTTISATIYPLGGAADRIQAAASSFTDRRAAHSCDLHCRLEPLHRPQPSRSGGHGNVPTATRTAGRDPQRL